MSMAYLDTAGSGLDRSGVSDPRLVAQVGRIPESTPEQLEAADRSIEKHARSARERALFRAMLGLESIEGEVAA